MKTTCHLLSAVIFLAFISCAKATDNENNVTGEVIFASDFKPELLEKIGYHYVGEGAFGKYKTNFFGAQSADIVVKNSKGEIIGVSKTKVDGTFVLPLEPSKFYQLLVEYRGIKREKVISSSDATKKTQINVGRFTSDDLEDLKQMF